VWDYGGEWDGVAGGVSGVLGEVLFYTVERGIGWEGWLLGHIFG
jgi:hypothetical protein